MPLARLALVGAVTTTLALTGCAQETVANDNRNSFSGDRTVAEPTIIRTPVKVDEAPATVPLPGPTGGPPGQAPTPGATSGPGGDDGHAETSEHGPDGT